MGRKIKENFRVTYPKYPDVCVLERTNALHAMSHANASQPPAFAGPTWHIIQPCAI